MKLRYTRRAFAEREAIYDYIEAQNPEGALNVKRAIAQAIRALALFSAARAPNRHGRRARDGRPALSVQNIYYRIEGDEIWILHLRDARRRPLTT
jgi:plasmid stabilization system protein ParE